MLFTGCFITSLIIKSELDILRTKTHILDFLPKIIDAKIVNFAKIYMVSLFLLYFSISFDAGGGGY